MRRAIHNRPLFTRTFEESSAFEPDPGSTYVFGVFEERSSHVDELRASSRDVAYVKVTELTRPFISVLEDPTSISLRRLDDVVRFLDRHAQEHLYVDITGLSHHVWAPLIKVALENGRTVEVVYVEPMEYRYSPNPIEGELFDLSERTDGIEPLPLFVSLDEAEEDRTCLVPLLGFEGARFAQLMESVDPPGNNVVPIIGVPGFRLEYPFHTYHGNGFKLAQARIAQQVRYARANCPFSLFYALEDVLDRFTDYHIKIAPIGTKPHALGAVLMKLASPRGIELVYDHPKRKRQRTTGAMRCLVYAVSDFFHGNPSNHNPRIP